MNDTKLEKSLKEDLKENYHYREFLSRLGIDPEDFIDEFDIEMDDYSK